MATAPVTAPELEGPESLVTPPSNIPSGSVEHLADGQQSQGSAKTAASVHSRLDQDEDEKKSISGPGNDIEKGETVAKVDEFDEYPEGGLRAWLVVLASVLLAFSTFGYANSWGIFQDYYQTNLLPNKSPSDIAWIGSVQYALVLLPGIISGRLMDLGYLHVPLGIASATQILAIFLAAECTQYWQFILCQGILLGLGAGFAFGPCLAITAHWFLKRRPVAYGVVATGSSIGGVVFPLAVKRLLEDVGFKWTMRITGFMLIFTFTLANLLVKKRLPPKNVKGGLFNFAIFLNPAFSLFATGCLLGFLGIYTALTYSDVAAIEAGLNPNLALSLVAIANGCSFFGRISSGLLAGRLGPFNILIPWTIVAGLMTWLWPYATTSGPGVVIVMVIYGCASGAFVGLIAIPLSHPAFGEQGDLGRRIGMIFTISALGALAGTPISGAIHTAVGGYKAVGWYAGSLGMLACVFLFLARRAAIGKWFARF